MSCTHSLKNLDRFQLGKLIVLESKNYQDWVSRSNYCGDRFGYTKEQHFIRGLQISWNSRLLLKMFAKADWNYKELHKRIKI